MFLTGPAVYGFIPKMKQIILIPVLQIVVLNLSSIRLKYWETLKLMEKIEF